MYFAAKKNTAVLIWHSQIEMGVKTEKQGSLIDLLEILWQMLSVFSTYRANEQGSVNESNSTMRKLHPDPDHVSSNIKVFL